MQVGGLRAGGMFDRDDSLTLRKSEICGYRRSRRMSTGISATRQARQAENRTPDNLTAEGSAREILSRVQERSLFPLDDRSWMIHTLKNRIDAGRSARIAATIKGRGARVRSRRQGHTHSGSFVRYLA